VRYGLPVSIFGRKALKFTPNVTTIVVSKNPLQSTSKNTYGAIGLGSYITTSALNPSCGGTNAVVLKNAELFIDKHAICYPYPCG
jgi:hypothetical protein